MGTPMWSNVVYEHTADGERVSENPISPTHHVSALSSGHDVRQNAGSHAATTVSASTQAANDSNEKDLTNKFGNFC